MSNPKPIMSRRGRNSVSPDSGTAADTTVPAASEYDKKFSFMTTTKRHAKLKVAATMQGKKINEVMNELMDDYIDKNMPDFDDD